MSDDTQPIRHDDQPKNSTRPAKLPELSDDDTDRTRAVTPESATKNLAPPPPPQTRQPHHPPPRRQNPPPIPYQGQSRQHGRARARRDSGLYLPIWSLVLMLVIVMGIAAGIIMLVIGLGGNQAPESEPVIILSTAIPTQRPASFPASPATSTLPAEVDVLRSPVAPLVLSGPTLATPFLSPTPRAIAVGETVIVTDVGVQELNVRDSAGVIDTSIVFRAPEGTRFVVVDGPRQGDGLTWWQIQDPFDSTRRGWAASNYLVPETITEGDS